MFHLLPEHERGVVYTLGRLTGVKGPGLVLLVPMLQAMRRVDLRPEVAQTRNAAVTWHVTDPARALEQVADYRDAMERLAQATFAKSLAGRAPDAPVFERRGMEQEIRKEMEGACSAWGIAIDKVVVNR